MKIGFVIALFFVENVTAKFVMHLSNIPSDPFLKYNYNRYLWPNLQHQTGYPQTNLDVNKQRLRDLLKKTILNEIYNKLYKEVRRVPFYVIDKDYIKLDNTDIPLYYVTDHIDITDIDFPNKYDRFGDEYIDLSDLARGRPRNGLNDEIKKEYSRRNQRNNDENSDENDDNSDENDDNSDENDDSDSDEETSEESSSSEVSSEEDSDSKDSGKVDSKHMYTQGRTRYLNSDAESRKRLEYFLPKSYKWSSEEYDRLGYFWFNGPRGKDPVPKR